MVARRSSERANIPRQKYAQQLDAIARARMDNEHGLYGREMGGTAHHQVEFLNIKCGIRFNLC
jgi:hypothetical protein